jgi:riboflavin synthase
MTRLGGHIVQGHVDARGTFLEAIDEGDFWTVRIGFPPQVARYFVEKGSVSVEGISLTIAALHQEHFDLAIIPKTWSVTNLSTLKPADAVNLEVDIIAKYVERIMAAK